MAAEAIPAIIDLFRAMTSEVGNLEPADYYHD
jgi:hypothetical protein